MSTRLNIYSLRANTSNIKLVSERILYCYSCKKKKKNGGILLYCPITTRQKKGKVVKGYSVVTNENRNVLSHGNSEVKVLQICKLRAFIIF